jgi:hypothetical protein
MKLLFFSSLIRHKKDGIIVSFSCYEIPGIMFSINPEYE